MEKLRRSNDKINEAFAQNKRLKFQFQESQVRLGKVLQENKTLKVQIQAKDEIILGLI